LKLVVLKIESPDLHRDQTFRTNLLSLGSLFIPASRRSENQGSYRTGSGMYHPIVKEQAPLSCRKAYRQSESIATPCSTVKRSARRFSTSAMRLLGCVGNGFHGKTLGERQVKSCFSMRGQLGYAAPSFTTSAGGGNCARIFLVCDPRNPCGPARWSQWGRLSKFTQLGNWNFDRGDESQFSRNKTRQDKPLATKEDGMKRVNRRQFAQILGSAALVPIASAVAVPALAWTQETPKKPEQPATPAKPSEVQPPQAEAPKPEPKPKLTAEQEEAVKKAVERRDRQLTALRSRTLPYDAEPAFVFQVRRRPRSAPKM